MINSIFNDYKEYRFSVGDADFIFFSDIGTMSKLNSPVMLFHSHKYCELFCVLSGTVEIHTEKGDVYTLGEGDCAFVAANFLHNSKTQGNFQRIVMSFTVEKNNTNADKKFFTQFNSIIKNDILIFNKFSGTDAFKRLFHYYYSSYTDKNELIISCLHEIVILIKASVNSEKASAISSAHSDSNSYRNYIIETSLSSNYNGITLKELSEYLHLSCQQTQRIIKKIYGQTFRERVVFIKMRNAKTLLLNTELSISQIASELGYIGTNSFFATFKKFYGVTPYKYRNMNNVSGNG